MNAFTVCIDGPAGSGKSTVARQAAKEIGFLYLDTGAIYRSLARLAHIRNIDWEDGDALAELASNLPIRFFPGPDNQRVLVDGEDFTQIIRSPEISTGASQVSRHPAVRNALLDLQRRIGHSHNCIVEGRDTGSVVFPEAQLKVFLIADVDVRAKRRMLEHQQRGESVSFEDIRAAVIERDRCDTEREAAPLVKAHDAVAIDTTDLTPKQVVAHIIRLIEEKRGEKTV